MDIVIIGSGNVATVVGRKIRAAGHRIIQVFSRQKDHASILASLLDAKPIHAFDELEKSDVILLAVPDNAYNAIIEELPFMNSLLIHTAGSLPMDILKSRSARYGVLYPLQTLRRELEIIPDLPLLIDANEEKTLLELKTFAAGLSKTVIHANDEARLKYHLAAVIVSNFTNHLFALTEEYCQKEKISFALLQPLMEETVHRLKEDSAAVLQTGPAVRNDTQTLQKHRELLNKYTELLPLYDALTRSIQRGIMR